MKVLALDIAKTATGWAVGDGRDWEWGLFKCPIAPPEGLDRNDIDADYAGAVADWFRMELLRVIVQYRPERAAIEKPLPGNITTKRMIRSPVSEFWGERVVKAEIGATAYSTVHFLHGLAMEACSLFHRRGVPCQYVAAQTWRKVVGIGRPPKSERDNRRWYKFEAVRQCQLRGIPVEQPDAAEAVLIGIWALASAGYDEKVRIGQLV
jgi:hypothetical protein